MVQVKGLTKSFTTKKISKKVLDAITFEAFDSQVFGLLGPNGAGKTTTLRTIATLLKPDVGTVSVDGYDVVSHGTEVRNRIGFLTGDMKLSGHLSCREMMQFFGALNHMEPKVLNKRIAELANQLGMEDFLDKQIAVVSVFKSIKHQIDGIFECHHKAGHAGIRESYCEAGLYLFLPQWDHGTAAGHHIAVAGT